MQALRIFSFIVFIVLPLSSIAHTGSIRGCIKDNGTHKPIDGVSVVVKETGAAAVADALGHYFIKNIPAGDYTIQLIHVGYEAREEKIKIEDGVTTELNISLNPSEVTLSSVTVNAYKDASINSVSNVDIKLRPVNTAQDLLRMVPGLFIAQHQGGGKAEQMFLRGFDADHGTDVNVSVDGMPVNMVSHAHGQGYADLHFLLPEIVDKMDFGKGPYQIDKGNFATAGWVEFKTREYLDNSFVKAEGGNFGHLRSVAGINLLNKETSADQSAYIAGEYAYDRGYFDQPQNFNRLNLAGKYTRRISSNKQISIFLSAFHSHWDASGQIPERAVDEGLIDRFGQIDKEGGKTSRYNCNIQFAQSLSAHSFFKSNLYVTYYDFELYSDFTFFLEDTVNGDQIRQKEKRLLTGYNANYVNNYHIGKFTTKTDAGLGLRFDNTIGSELSHTLNETITLRRIAYGDIYETNPYAYINQVLYLTPQLVLHAGTRFDYFIHTYDNKLPTESGTSTYEAHALSPKAGMYYNLGNYGRIYFNYGTGFHSNDTRVVVARQAKDILPLAYSYDMGAVVKPYEKMLLSAAIWRLDLQQEFVYVGDEGVVEPSGPTRRLGVDLSLRYELTKWLYWDEDFNYTHGRFTSEPEGQNYIPLAPVVTSIGGLTMKLGNRISGSIRYRYMGNRPATEDNSVTAKGYTVFDALINYSKSRYELSIQVLNLFNTVWNEAQFDTETRLRNETAPISEICFTPGTPFAIKLIAMYKF